MPRFSGAFIAALKQRAETPERWRRGVLAGNDPSAFNPADPLRLWIIQAGLIIVVTQLLALVLGKIRQPKVIAEVIGGIILGPTALGHIPGFTKHIFPIDSRPFISLVANIGLVLFLFIVGLEIDSAIVTRNARLSATVALAGMTVPFGLGAGVAVPIYHAFVDPSVRFAHFMLFTGVAFSITAFSILCRILTELKLLDTTVGIVALSAGVVNDIVGWTLLALIVALVNSGTGLTALWILIICVAWTLVLLFPIKMALLWLARRTGSIDNGPTTFFLTVTILLVFGSAFLTDIIGVHAIFGAFVVGIIVPREGGLAISITEKLEDMVTIIFLPLYFTLTGLSTNLGLLTNGITWAYTIAICAVAFTGKFGGCAVAARFTGFSWREAGAIGSLMSCKGLVEFIVLNIGLDTGILSERVFSMFVLEALTLTFMTTPLVSAIYPPERRKRGSIDGANFLHVADDTAENVSNTENREGDHLKTKFTVVLDKVDHLPSMMALTQLLNRSTSPCSSDSPEESSRSSQLHTRPPIDAIRLIELSDRTSAVMKSSVADTLLHTDPLLAIFRMFGELQGLPVSTSLTIVPFDDLAHNVTQHAHKSGSELILVPWLSPIKTDPHLHDSPRPVQESPFDGLFRVAHATTDQSTHAMHSQFVRGIFSQSQTDVALFIDQGHEPGAINAQHIFLPFFGGPDDRLALELVVQLCSNPNITATVVKLVKKDITNDNLPRELDFSARKHSDPEYLSTLDTVYAPADTQTRMQSHTADQMMWARFAANGEPRHEAALSRIQFSEALVVNPLRTALDRAASLVELKPHVLTVVGRSRRSVMGGHQEALKQLMEVHGNVGNEVKRTLGDVATAFLVAGRGAGIIVLQAAHTPADS